MIVLILSDKEFLSIDPAPSNRDLFFTSFERKMSKRNSNDAQEWKFGLIKFTVSFPFWTHTVEAQNCLQLEVFCPFTGNFLHRGRRARHLSDKGKSRRENKEKTPCFIYNFFYLLACRPALNTISVPLLHDTFQITLEKNKTSCSVQLVFCLTKGRENLPQSSSPAFELLACV